MLLYPHSLYPIDTQKIIPNCKWLYQYCLVWPKKHTIRCAMCSRIYWLLFDFYRLCFEWKWRKNKCSHWKVRIDKWLCDQNTKGKQSTKKSKMNVMKIISGVIRTFFYCFFNFLFSGILWHFEFRIWWQILSIFYEFQIQCGVINGFDFISGLGFFFSGLGVDSSNEIRVCPVSWENVLNTIDRSLSLRNMRHKHW